MKIVSQSRVDADLESEEFRSGRKNFLPLERRVVGRLYPAWTFEGTAFQLTLHTEAMQSSPVMAFASGCVKEFHNMDVARVEIIGVVNEMRGRALGVKMHEFIMKNTGLPLVASHTQTPDGRDLWFRMLKHARRMALYVVFEGTRYKLLSEQDLRNLPFDPFDGKEATFLLEKQGRERTRDERKAISRIKTQRRRVLRKVMRETAPAPV